MTPLAFLPALPVQAPTNARLRDDRIAPVPICTAAPPHTATSSKAPPSVAPLLIRAARGEKVPRPPVWLMRQAGRYMSDFRAYSDVHPFRHRSETPDIATELSLQPWRAFQTDAVIMFSDILTPLPALSVPFDIVRGTGPVIPDPLRTDAHTARVTQAAAAFNPTADLPFVAEVLRRLREEIAGTETALLGFVGAPFTLAAYMIEGRAQKNVLNVKRFMYSDHDHDDGSRASPQGLHSLLSSLADAIATYAIYQIDAGAQAVQLFDSWAHHLSPTQYAEYAAPYAGRVVKAVKLARPDAAVIFFANGSAGKLACIRKELGGAVDVIGVDWGVEMSEARNILGNNIVLQGNVDPAVLAVGSDDAIRRAVRETVRHAGQRVILNLGHGVVQQTPERAVKTFVEAARGLQEEQAEIR